MKRFVKIISAICALATLLGAAVSCGKQKKTENTAQNTTAATTAPKVTFDYENGDRLDPTLDFDDEVFNIYTWNTQMCNDWVTEVVEETGAVDRTLYNHMKAVEDRLKLEFHIETKAGRYNDRNAFIEELERRKGVGMSPDLVSQYSLSASIGMLKGVYQDISDAKHLDFDAPWWNPTLIEGNKVNGGLYYLTGDISPTIFYNMNGVMFNKTLLADYGIEAPYDLVREGNWTYAKFLELIADTAVNPNTNFEYSGSTENVMYGLTLMKLAVDAFQTGFGITAIEKSESGTWQYSKDFKGSRAADLVDVLRNLAYNNNDVFYDKNTTYDTNRIFNENHALFSVYTMYYVQNAIRDYGLTVGVVPTPKYDAAQTDYATRLGITTTLFSIPEGLDAEFSERSGAVLEALASDGYHRVTPVVFESTFCSTLADAADDAEMFNVIRDSIVYDPGNFIDTCSTYSAFRNAVNYDQAWTTFFEERTERFVNGLAEINQVGKQAKE